MELICIGCNKHPNEIEEYIIESKSEGISPDEYVLREEGTLNHKTGQFLCTNCYIKAGMPSSPQGWKAGDNMFEDLSNMIKDSLTPLKDGEELTESNFF